MSAAAPAVPLTWWLPALQRFDPASPLRQWLRRAERASDGAVGYLGGLQAAFDTGAAALAAAALTRDLLAGDAGAQRWLSADPAWIQPDINGARLLACGQLGLSAEDARELADSLLATFADAGMQLEATSPDRWHLRVAEGPVPQFAAPEQALGEDLYMHLPQGVEGRRWRALMTEAQVILHQHPLNAQRRERGLPPINSLWLWGGGSMPAHVRSAFTGVVGDDVLLRALAQRAGVQAMSLEAARPAALGKGWMVDLQGLPREDIESTWFERIRETSRRQPVMLHFASGERWLHKPWHRLRFWCGGGK